MNIVTDYADIRLARLLRRVGFDVKVNTYWTRDIEQTEDYQSIYYDTFHFNVNDGFMNWNVDTIAFDARNEILINLAAPSLYIIQKWLIEKYRIFVEVQGLSHNELKFQFILTQPCYEPTLDGDNSDGDMYDSYQEALYAGIEHALNGILNKEYEDK